MSQMYEPSREPQGGVQTAVAERPKPILNDEDEDFLERLATALEAPPLPEQTVAVPDNDTKAVGKDAQEATTDGTDKLPSSHPSSSPIVKGGVRNRGKAKEKASGYLSYVRNIPGLIQSKTKGKGKTGTDFQATEDAAKKGEITETTSAVVDGNEVQKEKDDLTSVLDQLNLSAVNNRAFSFSETSQKMMAEFTQILKDIINGAPTAYDDLESFLKNWDEHLRKMYGDLPPFLQNLVKSLPTKVSSTVAPGLLAAASEKPGADAKAKGIHTSFGSKGKRSTRQRIPSLKKLVGSQAAITKMLQSILSFLKLRFPAIIGGTNILMSIAVFLLLFVFWYCHKRGKETRLERERLAAGEVAYSDSDFESTASETEHSAKLNRKDDAKVQRILNQSRPA